MPRPIALPLLTACALFTLASLADAQPVPMPLDELPPGNAPVAEKIAALNWQYSGGGFTDRGTGCVMRAWVGIHRSNFQPLWIHWERPVGVELAHIDLYLAWRNFAPPRFTPGNEFYDADYLRALYRNRTAQSKRVRLPADRQWIVDTPDTNGRVDYAYLKLVGVTPGGQFVDLCNCTAGTPEERADERWGLQPAPESTDEATTFERPDGDRDLKTRWEEYGNEWAPGHAPPPPPRIYPDGDAPLAERMAALDWTHGSSSSPYDRGEGTALRVWETAGRPGTGEEDLVYEWNPDLQVAPFVAVDVYLAWRNFQRVRFDPDSEYHDVPYMEALFANQTAQTKRIRIAVPDSCALVDRVADNGVIDYSYAKLVGVTADGQFVDVLDWSVASATLRADDRYGLRPVPDSPEPFARVQGNPDWRTRWESVGREWAPGHEPPPPPRVYPPGEADVATRLGALTWDYNGGLISDQEKGRSLKNQETGDRGGDAIIVAWSPQPFPLVAMRVFFAWRNFAVPRFNPGSEHFAPDYLRALWANETAQARNVRIPIGDVPDRRFVIPATPAAPHSWTYLKLVGEMENGQLVDVVGWSIGSEDMRADERMGGSPVDASGAPEVPAPDGHRELMTRWETVGREWAPGHEPPPAPRSYPPGDAGIPERLVALDWSRGGNTDDDDGDGRMVRNWTEGDRHGNVDCWITWQAQDPPADDLVAIDVYLLRTVSPFDLFHPERVERNRQALTDLFTNSLEGCQRVRVPTSDLTGRVIVDRVADNGTVRHVYVKLVGVTADGRFVDICGYRVAGLEVRGLGAPDPLWGEPYELERE